MWEASSGKVVLSVGEHSTMLHWVNLIWGCGHDIQQQQWLERTLPTALPSCFLLSPSNWTAGMLVELPTSTGPAPQPVAEVVWASRQETAVLIWAVWLVNLKMRQQAAGDGNPCSAQLLWQKHAARRMQQEWMSRYFLDVLFAQKQRTTSWTELFLNFTWRLLRFKQNKKQKDFSPLYFSFWERK